MTLFNRFKSRLDYPIGDTLSDRREQACYWVAILESEQCRPAQRKSFEHWLDAVPGNRELYAELRDTLETVSTLSDDSDILKLRAKMLGHGVSPGVKRSTVRRFVFAMILVVGFAGMGLGLSTIGISENINPAGQVNVNENVSRLHVKTEIGERLSRTLSDGSTLDLNTNSEVRVEITAEQRNIYLLRGQAVFDVAHDETRPFSVYAADQKITALGTVFEVRMDDLSAQVTLLEGKVTIDQIDLTDVADIDQPKTERKIVELSPGERYASAEAELKVISPEALETSLSWRQGRHIFVNAEISEIVEEINRYTTRKVVLNDPAIGELVASANFKLGSTRSLAVALEANFGLSVSDNPQNDYILINW